MSDSPKTPSDNELAAAAMKDDQTALELLVKRHLSLVYNIAKRYVLDTDDAEDITQEVFVKVWKNLKSYKPDRNFRGWIAAIAKNASLDFLKNRKHLPFSAFENQNGENFLYETVADNSPNPYELASNAGSLNNLRLSLSQLAAPYREVVIKHNQEDLTFHEIAESTNQSINTVKSRYRRAIALLRKIL